MTHIETEILDKSLSYADFRSLISDALANDPASLGLSDDYLKYAELNEARLHRWDKTLKVEDEMAEKLKSLNKRFTWLVISESWCGDAAQSVPVLNKMAEVTENVDLRIVFRDQNLPLMDAFLTNGGRAIPKLVVLEAETNKVLADWGPRPFGAAKIVSDYKEQHGKFDEEGVVALQKWYAKNKGLDVQKEIVDLMVKVDQ